MSHPREKRPFCATQEEGELLGGISLQLGRGFTTSGHKGFVTGGKRADMGTLLNTSVSQESSNLV